MPKPKGSKKKKAEPSNAPPNATSTSSEIVVPNVSIEPIPQIPLLLQDLDDIILYRIFSYLNPADVFVMDQHLNIPKFTEIANRRYPDIYTLDNSLIPLRTNDESELMRKTVELLLKLRTSCYQLCITYAHSYQDPLNEVIYYFCFNIAILRLRKTHKAPENIIFPNIVNLKELEFIGFKETTGPMLKLLLNSKTTLLELTFRNMTNLNLRLWAPFFSDTIKTLRIINCGLYDPYEQLRELNIPRIIVKDK